MKRFDKLNFSSEKFLFSKIQLSRHIFCIWLLFFLLLLDIYLITSPSINFSGCLTVIFWSILLLGIGYFLYNNQSTSGKIIYWIYNIFWSIMIVLSILLRGYCKADKRAISHLDYTAFAGTGGIEIKEFLQYKGVSILQNLLFPAFIFLAFIGYIYYRHSEIQKKQNATTVKHTKKSIYFLLFSFILASLFSPFTDFILLNFPYHTIREIVTTARFKKDMLQYKITRMEQMKQWQPVKKEKGELTFILIGESATSYGMGCYFSPYNTTPFFSSVKNNPSYFFFDGYACSYYTAQAVPAALSFSNYHTQFDVLKTPTLFELTKELDFYTYFLTNQPKAVTIEILTEMVTDKQTLIKNVNRSWHEGDDFISYDETVIPLIEEKLTSVSQDKNALFVIQLFGSHYPFEKRVPKTFALPFQYKFDPEQETEIEARNTATYLASISYTDHILKDFFAMLEKNLGNKVPYSVIYFSDHGENPNYTRGDRPPSLMWLRIPYVIYLSPAYRKKYPQTVKTLRQNTRFPVSNDLTANIFTALNHITFKNITLPEKYDLTSQNYSVRLENLSVNEGKSRLIDIIHTNTRKQ